MANNFITERNNRDAIAMGCVFLHVTTCYVVALPKVCLYIACLATLIRSLVMFVYGVDLFSLLYENMMPLTVNAWSLLHLG